MHDSSPSVSPYHFFTARQWSALGGSASGGEGGGVCDPGIEESELRRIEGIGDRISSEQVRDVYLPLIALIRLHHRQRKALSAAAAGFHGRHHASVPYIVGLAGSVAAGKSTSGRLIKRLLEAPPDPLRVDLIATDGFLYPNATLEARGAMRRKGWPESYDLHALLAFLKAIKSGARRVEAPVYSHLLYDIVPDRSVVIEAPDIVIVEGLNILQVGVLPDRSRPRIFASDFFDFSIYLDADSDILRRWYRERFMKLRETAFAQPKSYFHNYAELDDETAMTVADDIWRTINLPNLTANILPTRERAHLILHKGADHDIVSVALRKL